MTRQQRHLARHDAELWPPAPARRLRLGAAWPGQPRDDLCRAAAQVEIKHASGGIVEHEDSVGCLGFGGLHAKAIDQRALGQFAQAGKRGALQGELIRHGSL
jgi:hypothetical protein